MINTTENSTLTLEEQVVSMPLVLGTIPDLILCADCLEYVPLDEAQKFADGKYYCIDGCEKRVKWFS